MADPIADDASTWVWPPEVLARMKALEKPKAPPAEAPKPAEPTADDDCPYAGHNALWGV